jgi:peptide/nickel transport system substrate-binding protein
MLLRVTSLALALSAALGVPGCSKPAASPAPTSTSSSSSLAGKKRLVIGISQEPDTLFMPFKEMNAAEHIGRPAALMLTVFDEQWKLVPQAAEAIPTVDNGGVVMLPDGAMRVTWRLKEGLFWADGVPVTADDFIFGWQLMSDPDLEVLDRASALRVREMTSPDPRTLVVTWKTPYAYYAFFRNHEPLPKHVLKPMYDVDKASLKQSPFGTRPLLGGGYGVAEWVPQSHITLKKNPHAVAFSPAQFDEIVWKIIPQTQTLEAAFLSGAVDVISVVAFTFDQARDFAARHPEVDTHFTRALMLEHIDLNLDHPGLKDRRVRQALMYALDREQLSSTLFGGKQPVAHSSEPDDNDDPGVVRYAYDPKRAAALLDEAGFVVGADGVRAKGDVALRFTLHSTAGDRLREQVEQLLVQWWKAIGIEVTIANQPAKLLFGDTIRRRKFDSMVMFTWTKEPNKIDETHWRCNQKPVEGNTFQGRNYPGFCDPEVDAWLDEAQHTVDDTTRRAIHRKIARRISEEVPMIPLYDRVDVSVTPKGFVGWKPTGVLQSVAHNAHEWRAADRAPSSP